MLTRQTEIEHAQRLVGECPFCGQKSAQLWYDPNEHMHPFQVRCSICGARGSKCDCGEEVAVPQWSRMQKKT